jgi:ketosteroid isomerase-like protein
MAEANVEVVRRVYEAAARRDAATVLALYDKDVELDASRIGVSNHPSGRDTYHGHDGLRELFREWHEAWGKIEYGYDELIEAGEQVIAVVTRHARGRASGVEVERPFALLWTLHDGRVVRLVWFLSREDALEAAGLSK